MLQAGISDRQRELQRVADVLARAAHKIQWRGAAIRVFLIILGAITATQGALDKLNPAFKDVSGLIFLLLGVLIAALAGIDTAFKFETKGAELNLLAASCHATVRQTDSAWYKQVGIEEDAAKQVAGAMQLIELQDTRLSEVQERAANSGVNIALEVRKLYRSSLRSVSGDDDDDDDDNGGERQSRTPYPA